MKNYIDEMLPEGISEKILKIAKKKLNDFIKKNPDIWDCLNTQQKQRMIRWYNKTTELEYCEAFGIQKQDLNLDDVSDGPDFITLEY